MAFTVAPQSAPKLASHQFVLLQLRQGAETDQTVVELHVAYVVASCTRRVASATAISRTCLWVRALASIKPTLPSSNCASAS